MSQRVWNKATLCQCCWNKAMTTGHSSSPLKPRLSAVCELSCCHGHTPSPGCQLSVGCRAAMGTLQAPVVSWLWAVTGTRQASLSSRTRPRWGKDVVVQRLELVSGASWQPRGTAVSRQSTRPYCNSRQSPVNPARPVTAVSRQSTRPYL